MDIEASIPPAWPFRPRKRRREREAKQGDGVKEMWGLPETDTLACKPQRRLGPRPNTTALVNVESSPGVSLLRLHLELLRLDIHVMVTQEVCSASQGRGRAGTETVGDTTTPPRPTGPRATPSRLTPRPPRLPVVVRGVSPACATPHSLLCP